MGYKDHQVDLDQTGYYTRRAPELAIELLGEDCGHLSAEIPTPRNPPIQMPSRAPERTAEHQDTTPRRPRQRQNNRYTPQHSRQVSWLWRPLCSWLMV